MFVKSNTSIAFIQNDPTSIAGCPRKGAFIYLNFYLIFLGGSTAILVEPMYRKHCGVTGKIMLGMCEVDWV